MDGIMEERFGMSEISDLAPTLINSDKSRHLSDTYCLICKALLLTRLTWGWGPIQQRGAMARRASTLLCPVQATPQKGSERAHLLPCDKGHDHRQTGK